VDIKILHPSVETVLYSSSKLVYLHKLQNMSNQKDPQV